MTRVGPITTVGAGCPRPGPGCEPSRPRPLANHPLNPARPPDWRWRRACELRAARARPRRSDDAWVRRARRHLGAAAPDPAIAAAAGWSEGPLGREVEARLLAGQGDDAIAARVGLGVGPDAVEAVAAFAALFFDAREADRRGEAARLAAVFLGAVPGPRPADPAGLEARLVGYHLGGAALDVLFNRASPGPGDPHLADDLRALARLMAAPVAAADAPRWLALAERLDEVEAAASAASAGPVMGPLAFGGIAAPGDGRRPLALGPDATDLAAALPGPPIVRAACLSA